MLPARFRRTPGDLHSGHSICVPTPSPRSRCRLWEGQPRAWSGGVSGASLGPALLLVVNVMSLSGLMQPPKPPCSFKAEAPLHCASLVRFEVWKLAWLTLNPKFSSGCQCQENHFMLSARGMYTAYLWGLWVAMREWCFLSTQVDLDPSWPKDTQA